jgi:hypothetical protein
VFLFNSRHKERDVQKLLVQVLNNNCSDVSAMIEGPRVEGRVNLTLAVQVMPLAGGKPVVEQAFAAVTKEFSSTGLSLVVDHPLGHEDWLVGLSWEGRMSYIHGQFRHQDPLGAGFWIVGLQLLEVFPEDRFPDLKRLCI